MTDYTGYLHKRRRLEILGSGSRKLSGFLFKGYIKGSMWVLS